MTARMYEELLRRLQVRAPRPAITRAVPTLLPHHPQHGSDLSVCGLLDHTRTEHVMR
ncbi:hypothetical protein [Streptomyces sp. NBC_01408]|uniref:hypothetical protein n=1 Tax=Streptomyces sp. NBC_01408 TaxID=2903855 RepID=UPI0022565A3A|nr:hypothetical protein [Streptomyces sp. NBC_01408]MCX4695465.1 hypothetical protein [Streptomyces sp. NBC_01408]